MGISARARDGIRFRRFLYDGLRLPGRAQIQARKLMATSTRVLELAVDDWRVSPSDCCTSIVAAILIS